MNVSDEVKQSYKSNSIHKNLLLHFSDLNLTIPHSQIYQESMTLKESIFDGNSIEFVGCIASSFKVKVNGVLDNLKGERVKASIYTDDTEEEPITLFNGIVDSAVKQSNKQIKEITAYDELYTKGNTEVAAWYKSLTFPITIKNFRYSLFNYIGLTQVETDLPNDNISISRQYDPNTLQALSVIKAICQINGAFGIINREGNFEYRILAQDITTVPYPATTLFPSTGLFPASPAVALAAAERYADSVEAESFSFYKSVSYEEFEVKPVDKLTIRQTEDDAGVTYGTGTNNYIIQGNMFTYGLSNSVLLTIAENIYNNVKGFSYHPFTSDNNGLPFLECGLDAVSYLMIDYEATYEAQEEDPNADVVYTQQAFYILNRELSGIQALRDSYSADGEEYQTEFITDLQTQIDILKKNTGSATKDYISDYVSDYVSDYTYDKDTIDSMLGSGGGFNVESVAELPSSTDENTIYLIQGIVVVE